MKTLISGAGFAGLSTAINLSRAGHDITIVERAPYIRDTGAPLDIRGKAITVAEAMGILPALEASRAGLSENMTIVDANGSEIAPLPGDDVSDSVDDIEIERPDLVQIMLEHLGENVDVIYNDSIETIDDRGKSVGVEFVSGRRESFDLVVGADGVHSLTRRLVFGPETQFRQFLGMYIALARVPSGTVSDRHAKTYSWPDHMVSMAPYGGHVTAAMYFRQEWLDYDYHDPSAQKQLALEELAGHDEWLIPIVRNAIEADPDFYFDSVNQVHMDTYHRGRVVLVGDAGYCPSPLSGRGLSLAMLGASHLAQALSDYPWELERALNTYETVQRPHVVRAQDTAADGGDLLVPATQEELDKRNARLRAAQSA
ncbi:FAD-dependent monooxygenase [Brevibacterium sp. FAM 25378]|uniref:FAD-dependent monooxygenase n=1 Tax=unclassified Brevibacterium TaxID=2614124 RepID=UPI0010928E60|nr:FAD-dependent monooxygenase [Brevibacterium sp. S22]TGD26338.1 monooxygenase [Brevibacterium sp. S22]